LLNEKQISDKHVIGLKEVDEMIGYGTTWRLYHWRKCRKQNHAKHEQKN
jgi:hypothetical protein